MPERQASVSRGSWEKADGKTGLAVFQSSVAGGYPGVRLGPKRARIIFVLPHTGHFRAGCHDGPRAGAGRPPQQKKGGAPPREERKSRVFGPLPFIPAL